MILKALARLLCLFTTLLLAINTAQANWSLDNDASTLSFVTVKADHVAEVHTFDVLSGSIGDAGEVADDHGVATRAGSPAPPRQILGRL